MEIRQFGPFKSLFDGVNPSYSGYLPLLGLRPGNATQSAIDRVERALHAGESQLWVDAMLAERNWRPHLPAALAFLLDRPQTLSPVSLWKAIDVGWWVTPQLVVAALFSDAEFPCKLEERLDDFVADRLTQGPAKIECWNPPKVAASLLAASHYCSNAADAVARWHVSPHLKRLIDDDASCDSSGDIVMRWKAAVEQAFLQRGIMLLARFSATGNDGPSPLK